MSFGDGMIWDDFWSCGWCGRSLILDDFDMNTEHNDLWTYYSDGSILLQVSGSAPQQWLDAEKKVAAATVPMSCIRGWTVFWKGNVDLVKHPDGPGYAYAMGSEGGSRHLFSIPCFGEREVLFLSFQTFRCNCLRSSSFVPSQNVLGVSRLELRRAAYQHWWLHTIPDDIACYIRFCSLIVEVIEHNGTCYLLSCVCTRSGTPHVSTQYLALCYVQKDPQVCITYIGFVGLFVPPELSNLRPSPISFQLWSKWRDLRKLFYRCSVYISLCYLGKTGTEKSEKESSVTGTGKHEQQFLSERKQPVTASQNVDSRCFFPLIQIKPCRWKAQPGNPLAVCKHDHFQFDSKIWLTVQCTVGLLLGLPHYHITTEGCSLKPITSLNQPFFYGAACNAAKESLGRVRRLFTR